MMGGCIVWVRCLPSGVVSFPGWCAYRLGDLPPSVSLCVDPGGCDGMELSRWGGGSPGVCRFQIWAGSGLLCLLHSLVG